MSACMHVMSRHARMDGWMDVWMDGWTHGWMDGWMDGGREGGMDGWMFLCKCMCAHNLLAGAYKAYTV